MNAREGVAAIGLVSAMVGTVGYLVVGVVKDWGWAFAAAGVMAGLLVAMALLISPKGRKDRWGALPVGALSTLVGAPITVPVLVAFWILSSFSDGGDPF